jgi:hypothetical protein
MGEGHQRLDNHELRERAFTHFPDIYFVSIGFTQSTVLGAIAIQVNEIINKQWPVSLVEFIDFAFHLLNTFGTSIGIIIVVSEYSRFIVLFRRVIEVRDITFPLLLGFSQYLTAVNIDNPRDAWWLYMGVFAFIGSLTLRNSLKYCKLEAFHRESEWVYKMTRDSVKRSMILHGLMSLIFFMIWIFLRTAHLSGWQAVTIKIAAYSTLLYIAILVLIDSTSFIPRLLYVWDQRGSRTPEAQDLRRRR